MPTLLDEPETQARTNAAPAERLRTTMAAMRLSFTWFGTRKTLTSEQRAQAAGSFGAEADFLSAGKKLIDTRHEKYKAVTAFRGRAGQYWLGQLVDHLNDRLTGEADQLARRASVQIPEQSRGMEDLIASYRASALASFHDRFYQDEHDPPEVWPQTYDRIPLDPLPACARRLLEQPNDWLLKPAGIQLLVRVLLSMGWSPRHIAGLIRSKYERDYGWGATWHQYDAATRADFYVRLFAGLIATGLDRLDDFNCLATRGKGYCCNASCGALLESYRNRLLAMRDHGEPQLFLPQRRIDPTTNSVEELANQSETCSQER
jgi:hypothetical protein